MPSYAPLTRLAPPVFAATILLLSVEAATAQTVPSTTRARTPQARMGDPMRELTPAQRDRFELGKRLFMRALTSGEGKGPAFNPSESGCVTCHENPAPGGMHNGTSKNVVRFGRVSPNGSFDPLLHLGGSLRQASGELIPPEANFTAERIPTPMFGDGLLEAIPDSAILQYTRFAEPGITGRGIWIRNPDNAKEFRLGRFGWKDQVATIRGFVADATLNEMGITNDLLRDETPPNGDLYSLSNSDRIGEPETNNIQENGRKVDYIQAISDYIRMLAPPPQTPRSGTAGEAVFNRIGCASCHRPSYVLPVGDKSGIPPLLQGRLIKPYSDLMLHDMGPSISGGLGDGIQQDQAGRYEMRTAPLWGISARTMHTHDGIPLASTNEVLPAWNAANCTSNWPYDSLDTTIRRHAAPGSEAAQSARNYERLSCADKLAIQAFFGTLGRAEFDGNRDNKVDAQDLPLFAACNNTTRISPDHSCAVFDYDQNGTVDSSDLNVMLGVYSGPTWDCDANLVPDPIDIVTQPSRDSNRDGRLDTCPAGDKPCVMPFRDLDSDGTVDCFDQNPFNPNSTQRPLCPQGLPDTPDSDLDGVPDCIDNCPNLTQISIAPCGCSAALQDADLDGITCGDQCPYTPLISSSGDCGCSFTNPADVDGDGASGCSDSCPFDSTKTMSGMCGCGIPDSPAIDSDGDGTKDCADECPFDSAKQSPGICGCGVPETSGTTDTDRDGTFDCRDLCPDDPNKLIAGRCGCGVAEDSCDLKAPTAPTNLSAVAISPTEINLSFTASTDDSNQISYKITRNGSLRASTTLSGFRDTGLTPDTEYKYMVRGCDRNKNCSAYSNIATTRTKPAPVPIPTTQPH